MSRTSKPLDPITVAKPHTVKKFELISSYVEEWAHKLLGYSMSQGIVYIDCMCNSGMYHDEEGLLIEGAAIRVVKHLNRIITNYEGKKAILCFNDIDENRVRKLQEFVNMIDHSNVEINHYTGDGNEFLNNIDVNKFLHFNTLMIYDPYDAAIDWNAITIAKITDVIEV